MAWTNGGEGRGEPLEVHTYSTPTARNADRPYSIGIMNATEREMQIIRAFVFELRSGRVPAAPAATAQRPLTDAERMQLKADQLEAEAIKRARERALTALRPSRPPSLTTSTDEPSSDETPTRRDRFEGLDL